MSEEAVLLERYDLLIVASGIRCGEESSFLTRFEPEIDPKLFPRGLIMRRAFTNAPAEGWFKDVGVALYNSKRSVSRDLVILEDPFAFNPIHEKNTLGEPLLVCAGDVFILFGHYTGKCATSEYETDASPYRGHLFTFTVSFQGTATVRN